MDLFAATEASPGTTINIMKDKIVWDDFGVGTLHYRDGKIESDNLKPLKDINMVLVNKDNNVQIKFVDLEKMPGCLYPFNEVAQ